MKSLCPTPGLVCSHFSQSYSPGRTLPGRGALDGELCSGEGQGSHSRAHRGLLWNEEIPWVRLRHHRDPEGRSGSKGSLQSCRTKARATPSVSLLHLQPWIFFSTLSANQKGSAGRDLTWMSLIMTL